MGRRVQIALAAVLALLVCAAVGAYAWDQAKAGEIANGIRVGGVPIGGLSEKQARQRIRNQLVRPLEQPITVSFEGKQYILSAHRLKIHADVAGMVDEAQSASREGSLPTRIWRYATGDNVYRNLPARVGYSHAAINDFVSTAADAIDRDATDATVQPSPSSLNAVPGKDGVALDQSKLRSQLVSAIGSGNQARIKAPVHRTKPQVTTAQLAVEVSDLHHRRPRRVHPSPLEEPEARQELSDRRRHVGPRHPRGLLHDRQQNRQPVLAGAEQRLGGEPGRQDDPSRPGGSHQGPVAGLLQRRRHPRHGRDRIDRHLRVPRLHQDADSRRDRACTPRFRSEPPSTSATDIARRQAPARGRRINS